MANSRPKETPKDIRQKDNVVDILPTERGNVFHQPVHTHFRVIGEPYLRPGLCPACDALR